MNVVAASGHDLEYGAAAAAFTLVTLCAAVFCCSVESAAVTQEQAANWFETVEAAELEQGFLGPQVSLARRRLQFIDSTALSIRAGFSGAAS